MNATPNSLPRLRLTTADHERLRLLVDTAIQSQPRLRETLAPLQAELKRAEVLAAADIPANVVVMGATVQIEDKESGELDTYTLVYRRRRGPPLNPRAHRDGDYRLRRR